MEPTLIFFQKYKSEKYFHFSSTHSYSVYSLGHFEPICTQSKMLYFLQFVPTFFRKLKLFEGLTIFQKISFEKSKEDFLLSTLHIQKIFLTTTFNRLIKSNRHVSSKQQHRK